MKKGRNTGKGVDPLVDKAVLAVHAKFVDDHDPYTQPVWMEPSRQEVIDLLVRFARRYGAAERRRALREAAEAVDGTHWKERILALMKRKGGK